nr:phospholipase-like protein [Tanacetum cinerariifolium]
MWRFLLYYVPFVMLRSSRLPIFSFHVLARDVLCKVMTWWDLDTPNILSRRVFCSSLDGRPIKRKNVETLIKSEAFKTLDDNNAVSLCCVGILQLVLLGLEDRRHIPNWILRLANDRDSWDKYPWGSHVWPTLYQQLKDANVRRWPALYATQPTDEVDKKSYSITGFAWAFKTWILESFRAATNDYYTRYRRLPRIVAWSSKNKFYRNILKSFLHGQLHVQRLVPDEIEARSRWWVSSRAYFDRRNIEDERIPRHLNRNNYFEVIINDMRVGPVPLEKEPIIADQHYGISDLSGFQSYQGVSSSFHTLANSISFFNMTTPLKWQTPTPSYLGPPNSQPPIPSHPVPHLCAYRSDRRSWPEGWLCRDHINSWIHILIRERAENDNWTLSKSGTICLHPENNRFMILTNPHIIETLDGSVRPYPSWMDVIWVYMPINVGGVHWVTEAINLVDSIFYVFDSTKSESRMLMLEQQVRDWTPVIGPKYENTFNSPPRRSFVGGMVATVDPVELERFSTNQVKRILSYSLGYDENSPTFFYLRKPNCSLDSGLVPLADALQDHNMLLMSNVLMKLQEALDEEAIFEEQILTLMHHFADMFTDRRVKINNLMVLHDHPLIDYGKYALGCMTGADMKKCVHLKNRWVAKEYGRENTIDDEL